MAKKTQYFYQNIDVVGLSANGTLGTNGQYLTTNGSSVFWAAIPSAPAAGNGLSNSATAYYVKANNGIVSNTSGVFVKANTGLVSNSSGLFVNASFTVNNANNATYLNGQPDTYYIGLASNAYANAIVFANTVANAAYANAVAYAASNTYVNSTFAPKNNPTFTGTLNAGDVSIAGNLNISGTMTYINTNQLNIGDAIITLNADLTSGTGPTENAGIEINRGSSANVQFIWDETNDRWSTNGQSFAAGTIYANTFTGTANNADYLGGVLANNYTRKDLTFLGSTGSVALDAVTNTAAAWAALPVGYSRMMGNAIGTAGGAPVNGLYGYFTKIANRDSSNGWAGMWVGYSGSNSYIGTADTSAVFATWQKIWTSANMGAGSTLDSDLLDGQQGSYYTNATNITTGTLPYAQIPANVVNTSGSFTIAGTRTHNANVAFNSNVYMAAGATLFLGAGSINATNFSGTANNADYLDGQHGSYYTNATNISTGTLPYAQIPVNVVNTTGAFTISGVHTYSGNTFFNANTQFASPYIRWGSNTNIIQIGTTQFTGAISFPISYNIESNGGSQHPFLMNDLGNFRIRGGTMGGNTTGTVTNSHMDSWFSGTPAYSGGGWANTTADTVLEFMNLPTVLNNSTWIGISFGSPSWSPNSITVEAYANGVWTTCATVPSFRAQQLSVVCNTYPVTGFRFTMGANTNTRINNIWATHYNSSGWTSLAMPRAGGAFYGNVSIPTSSTLTVGNVMTVSTANVNVNSQLTVATGNVVLQTNTSSFVSNAGQATGVFGTNFHHILAYGAGGLYRHAVGTRHASGANTGNAIDFYLWDTTLASSALPANVAFSLDRSGSTLYTPLTVTANLSVSGTISATAFTGQSNTALTANNSAYLGGVAAASYQLNSTLSANVATMTANNSAYLGGVVATNYVRKDLTYLGYVGNISHDAVTNTAAAWAALPVGYSRMMSSAIGTAGGAPIDGSYGYFTKIANRDFGGGWAGLWVTHSTSASGSSGVYVGLTTDGANTAIWQKLWTTANMGAGSTLDADLLDGQQGTYYLNSNNFTGVLPYATIPANVVNTTSNFTITGVHTHSGNTTFTGNVVAANATVTNLTVTNPIAGSVTTPSFTVGQIDLGNTTINNRLHTGFYQTSNSQTSLGWPTTTSGWAHLISSTHSNQTNYYAMQFASEFGGTNPWWRVTSGANTTSIGSGVWSKIPLYNVNGGAGFSLYSNVLYDADNTAYFFDGNNTSVVNGLSIYGGFTKLDSSQFSMLNIRNNYANSTVVGVSGLDFQNENGYPKTSIFGRHNTDGSGHIEFYTSPSGSRTADTRTNPMSLFYNQLGVYASSGIAADIYYDRNNSSYYVDPNNSSVVNVLTTAGNLTASQQFNVAGEINMVSASEATRYIDHYGSLVFRYSDNSTFFNNAMTINSAGYVTVNNYLTATASVRAPVFYDSDNTSFYADPAGTSVLSNILTNTSQSRVKLSPWNSITYGIGMHTGFTYGSLLNEYAMTFQMDSAAGRGWWWGSSSHANSQGSAALSVTGNMVVANSFSVGYGTSTTASPIVTMDVNGVIRAASEIQSTNSNQFRQVQGNYGVIHRNDGSNYYILLTASGDAYGSWNSLRPFTMDVATGLIQFSHNVRSPVYYDLDNTLYYLDAAGFSQFASAYFDNWVRPTGNTGVYFESWGGGWHMTDSTWIRAFNNKAVFTGGEIAAAGNITAYYSDERLKTVTGSLHNAIEKVQSLNGFTYVENELARSLGYKNDKRQVGVSAQQVQAVLPEAVSLAPFDYETLEDGSVVSKSGENYLTVDYSRLVPLLIEAIKEQQMQINTLTERISELEV